MSSGIKYNSGIFPWNDKPKIYYWPDLRQLTLNVEIERRPCQSFHYNNYNPFLLGMILERVVHKSVAAYLEEKIWKSLGMEYPAFWSIDSKKSGFEKMEAGINARAIDLAKFARLYLHKGNWNGKQIIPKEWVIKSTKYDPAICDKKDYYRYYDKSWGPFFQNEKEYYKYFWWGYSSSDKDYDFFAMGNLGQFIYISPHKDLIIIRFGKKWGDVDWWPEVFKGMAEKIY
jgi:CubicO group peptidase (beta-lactamase class C family)